MSERDRASLLDSMRARGAELDRHLDLVQNPPGHRFTTRYLLPHAGCKGKTREGFPCAAHPQIIGSTGYCGWHDPDLKWARQDWCAARRGPRSLRWLAQLARITGDEALAHQARTLAALYAGHADSGRDCIHPVSALADPALDALPMGQRRVVEALLAPPLGRSYPEAAAILGIHLGTLHAHLARIRKRHPATYEAIMAKRAGQLERRHEAAAEREYARTATRRTSYVEAHGREPWAA